MVSTENRVSLCEQFQILVNYGNDYWIQSEKNSFHLKRYVLFTVITDEIFVVLQRTTPVSPFQSFIKLRILSFIISEKFYRKLEFYVDEGKTKKKNQTLKTQKKIQRHLGRIHMIVKEKRLVQINTEIDVSDKLVILTITKFGF